MPSTRGEGRATGDVHNSILVLKHEHSWLCGQTLRHVETLVEREIERFLRSRRKPRA
ncbi:hypothetical protein AB0I68_38695 [Streptomyces sp. NPDC050448]|uniref:hypothetical protein n=1 Tax=Streptomyces sp. NPDC050448 TaxID=3155404 RepID=UPI003413D490